MKKKLCIPLLALLLLCLLSACTDGPLIATATPVPTAEPTPEPTPETEFQENVFLPDDGLAALLPSFRTQLETLAIRGEELLFASFTEADGDIIDAYRLALKEAGFTEIIEENEMIYSAALEGSEGLIRVQLFYDGVSGTLQVNSDK